MRGRAPSSARSRRDRGGFNGAHLTCTPYRADTEEANCVTCSVRYSYNDGFMLCCYIRLSHACARSIAATEGNTFWLLDKICKNKYISFNVINSKQKYRYFFTVSFLNLGQVRLGYLFVRNFSWPNIHLTFAAVA